MTVNENFRYLNIGLPEDILRRKLGGDLAGAVRLIDKRLAGDLPEALRACLTAEREMILRTPRDYPYTRAEALAIVREHIPDFTEEEFDARVDACEIGWIWLNGEEHFFRRFFQTLYKTDAAFAARAGKVQEQDPVEHLHAAMAEMKEKGSISRRIRVKASAAVNPEYFEDGMFVRVHLPVPAACDQQSDIRIERISPEGAFVAPEDAPQRTVCWEENMTENHPFEVEYSYIHTARYHDTDLLTPDAEQPDFFTGEEAPHIVFTPYIRALTASLTEGVTDPLEKARRIYDFITLNMHYTFMPAYFILENIAESCARNYCGDCGVFALLFITLCRCAGIPARWQSGMAAEPHDCGSHDWAQFYVAPYGWLYADPSYGVSACKAGDEERRKFYFGNLDPYRMVANCKFQAEFIPPKAHWRADPYDNQSGEIETVGRALNYDEYTREMETLSCEEVDQ